MNNPQQGPGDGPIQPMRHLLSVLAIAALSSLLSTAPPVAAQAFQGAGLAAPGGYGLKIYRVESGLYPFVNIYFRTFDQFVYVAAGQSEYDEHRSHGERPIV